MMAVPTTAPFSGQVLITVTMKYLHGLKEEDGVTLTVCMHSALW